MRSLLLILLFATTLHAAPEPLPYARTPKEAVHMAKTRGKMIFITAVVDGDEENRLAVKNVLHSKKWQKIAREFVLVYANKDRDHGTIMVKQKDGKRVPRDADVPELTSDQVVNFAHTYVAAFLPDEAEGLVKTPIHFIVDANEDVVDIITNGDWKQGFHHVPVDTVIARMKKALKKHGEGISEKQYATMQKSLVDAKAAKARKNVPLEIKCLLKVTALPAKLEDVKTAQARLDAIEKGARAELADIEAGIKRYEYLKSLDRLAALQKTYAGLPVAKAAKDRDKKLRKEKDVKIRLKARDLYQQGMKLKKAGKTDRAIKKFAECVRRAPGTRWAQLAEKELSEPTPTDE